MIQKNDCADSLRVRNPNQKQEQSSTPKLVYVSTNQRSRLNHLVTFNDLKQTYSASSKTQILSPTSLKLPLNAYRSIDRLSTHIVFIVTVLALMTISTASPCLTLCDSTFLGKTVTSATGTTIASDTGVTMTTAYLDPEVTKPATGFYYLRSYCAATPTWADCATGVSPLQTSYTVSISPAACQSALYWDVACTLPCTTNLSVGGNQAFSISAKALFTTPVTAPTGTVCTVSYENKNVASTTTTSTYTFSLQILACNANTLAWTTASFLIAAQTYYVHDTAMIIQASLATQTNACGYSITYSLLNSPSLTTADTTVFSVVAGTPNTISIQTNTFTKAGTYTLAYRASLTNTRTGLAVNLDTIFTVTIVDRCATAIFTTVIPALTTMSTTALSTTSVTQTLYIKDSVSSANGNSDGWTFCGNRVFTISSGVSPQTFLTVTSNSFSSTITLLSNQLSDATACPIASPCTVTLQVCFVNYPTICTTSNPSFQVSIGPCVVTSYTAIIYADLTYTIKTAVTTTPYPTFTQTPACNYSPTKTVTVNGNAFPGVNLNGGASMSSIFTDDTTNNRFSVVDNTLLDGTNTYNFAFTSTLPVTPVVQTSSTFNIILANPCLSTTVQDSGQTLSLSGTELQTTTTSSYAPFTQFKNSYSGTSVDPTLFCGPYTYSLTSYTGTFLVFDPTTPSIGVMSVSNTDNSASPYSIGLKGCLTLYPTLCYTKPLIVTIADCVISSYTMTAGQTALTTTTPVTYTIGEAAVTITLPTFTQSPDCDYSETKTCYLTASPTACPSWVTATQTSFIIQCTTPATCPSGTYDLQMKSALSNTAGTNSLQTQRVIISDPCPTSVITAGTVNDMTTSALSTTTQTQTLSQWSDSASSASGITSMCGATTLTLQGTYLPSFISISGTTLTLLSTSLTDVGIWTNVQVKQCLTAYPSVCATKTFTVTVTACEVTSWTPNVLADQTKYINDPSSTSGFTTWTQVPSCAYTYATSVSISGTALPTLGVSITTPGTTLSYLSTTRSDANTYIITWTPTVSASCLGVCTITAATSTLIWKDPCQRTVLVAPTVTSKSTTAMDSSSQIWTFPQVQDSLSQTDTPSDGITYCGIRTYTITGNGAWLTIGSGATNNQLTLLSTSPTDNVGSPFTIQLTVTLPAYSDVLASTCTFTITIGPCVISTFSVTGTIAAQTYVVGAVQKSVALPSFTQNPACAYSVAYTFTRNAAAAVTSDALLSLTSQTQFDIGFSTDTTLSGPNQMNHQIVLKATLSDTPVTVNSVINFDVTVINPCATTTWVANTITVAPIPLLQVVSTDITIKDTASVSAGNLDGVTLCGDRVYTWTLDQDKGFTTQITTSKTGDTIMFAPTTTSQMGTYTLKLSACLTTYITACYTQYVLITVNPCEVTSSTKSASNTYTVVQGSTVIYTLFESSTLSFTFPTYTQTPSCGYTWVQTLMKQDNTAAPSFITKVTSPDGYTIFTTAFTDAGTYAMKLSMTLASYPSIYTMYEDASLTWTVIVEDPCFTTSINAFTSIFATMTATVLGSTQYQVFSQPTDVYSASKDTILSYYTVPTPYSSGGSYLTTVTGPAGGINICGARSLTIAETGCAAFLSITSYLGQFQLLELSPTLASQITVAAGISCTVTASLLNYPSIAPITQNVQVIIQACVITSLTLTTPPPNMKEYDLFGAAVQVSFPVYTQSPACGYTPTYICNAEVHTAAMQTVGTVPTPTTLMSTITNLANWVTCDTTLNQVTADITSLPTLPTDLTSTGIQYNGDYNIGIQTTIGTVTETNFVFQLRVINPCGDPSLLLDDLGNAPSAVKNSITPSSILDMSASVKAVNPIVQTWTAFTDAYSILIQGATNGYTLCGARTYSYSCIPCTCTWLTMATPAATPNANQFSVSSWSDADIGDCTVSVTASLNAPEFSNITASTTFVVHLIPCVLTSFNAPTLADQTYTVYTGPTYPGPQLEINLPVYTQTPACGYSVTYSSQIKKTADANAFRGSYFPDTTTSYQIDSTGVLLSSGYLYFIRYSSITNMFYISTDDLVDAGTYTITITAKAQDSMDNVKSSDSFSVQLTIVDPCTTTSVNNIAFAMTMNVVPPNPAITTSVKLGIAQSYQFFTYLDSVSYSYGQYAVAAIASLNTWLGTEQKSTQSLYLYPYDQTTENVAQIYCGRRQYFFNGATTPTPSTALPSWLTFDETKGILSVQTDDDSMVNYSPGHSVTIKACLEYYPTVCSTEVAFIMTINQCQIVSFTPVISQPNLVQYIFDAAVSQPIATYTQTPACGWTPTYTASITAILSSNSKGQTYTGTETVGQTVVTGAPAWATFDTTPAAPKWTMKSVNYLDATVFTINQVVTLNDQIQSTLIQTSHAQTFTVEFKDPCWDATFIKQNNAGETFDSVSSTPLITTSVKWGTDSVPVGISVTKTFEFHHDTASDSLTIAPSDSSNWVCGPRTYATTVMTSGASQFMSVIDSPATSTLTKPILSALTSLDSDVAWNPPHQVTLSIFLTRYPTVVASETFWVEIDQCILNTLTEDWGTQIQSLKASPFTFQLYTTLVSSLALPQYTQAPQCGYQLSYTLTQIETWNAVNSAYNTNQITCTFAALDNIPPLSPTSILFASSTWTDDQCKYGPVDENICNLVDSNPYRLQLKAYIDPSLIVNPPTLVFPTMQNTDEKFYVHPVDPCHATTLTPAAVPNKIYFLGDSVLKISVARTQDAISLDTTGYYLVDSTGYDKCGPRNYRLFTQWMQTPSFASIPFDSNPPVISILTSNTASAGYQNLILMSFLTNYPHITSQVSFQVIIYNFSIGKVIRLQYYQITKPALTLTWAPFTISPTPPQLGTMGIYYVQPDVIDQATGLLIQPPPVWLSANLGSRTLTVQTNNQQDEGVYEIVIYGALTGYSFRQTQMITLIISVSAPVIISSSPPTFTQKLLDQSFKVSEGSTWTLPDTYSEGDFDVSATMTTGPKWLNFDSRTLTFSVKQDATVLKDVGNYTIEVTLKDPYDGKASYKFNLICVGANKGAGASYLNADGKQFTRPVPTITKISSRGLVTIVWDQQMRIPSNLNQVASGKCQYFNTTTNDIENQLNLDVSIMPGEDSLGKNLAFTWSFNSWDVSSMTIQLIFVKPEDVSSGQDLERLKLIFYGMTYFMSQSGATVNGGPDPSVNSVLIQQIPPQAAAKQTKWPDAFIQKIEPSGLMHVAFYQTMKIPDNPQNIKNDTVLINDTVYPILKLEVIAGKYSDSHLLEFNWTLVSFAPMKLLIKLDFENEGYVSSHSTSSDAIQLTIYGYQFFEDTEANLMQTPKVLKRKDLPQLASESNLNSAKYTASIFQSVVKTNMVANTILSLVILGPIQALLNSVKQLQIIVHMMLISVSYPVTTTIYFGILMEVLTFQFYDFSHIFDKIFSLDPNSEGDNAINSQFDLMGYSSLFIIQNFGTLCWTIFLAPIAWLGSKVLSACFKDSQKLVYYKLKFHRLMFFDYWIRFIGETYLFLAVCAALNIFYLRWSFYGETINSALSILMGSIIIAYPIFVGVFYNVKKNYDRIIGLDRDFLARFGSILQGLNFKRRGKLVLIQTFSSIVRKLWLAYIVVFKRNHQVKNIIQLNFQALLMLTITGYTEPMISKGENNMELLNEGFVLIFSYHLYQFTDFMTDLPARAIVGQSLVVFSLFNVVVNMGVILINVLYVGINKLKRHVLRCKQRSKIRKNMKTQWMTEIQDKEKINKGRARKRRNEAVQVNQQDSRMDSRISIRDQDQSNVSNLSVSESPLQPEVTNSRVDKRLVKNLNQRQQEQSLQINRAFQQAQRQNNEETKEEVKDTFISAKVKPNKLGSKLFGNGQKGASNAIAPMQALPRQSFETVQKETQKFATFISLNRQQIDVVQVVKNGRIAEINILVDGLEKSTQLVSINDDDLYVNKVKVGVLQQAKKLALHRPNQVSRNVLLNHQEKYNLSMFKQSQKEFVEQPRNKGKIQQARTGQEGAQTEQRSEVPSFKSSNPRPEVETKSLVKYDSSFLATTIEVQQVYFRGEVSRFSVLVGGVEKFSYDIFPYLNQERVESQRAKALEKAIDILNIPASIQQDYSTGQLDRQLQRYEYLRQGSLKFGWRFDSKPDEKGVYSEEMDLIDKIELYSHLMRSGRLDNIW